MLSLRQAYAVGSRFYPTLVLLLATKVDSASAGGHNVLGLGFLVGCSVLPQVLDFGLARRTSIDAALIADKSTLDSKLTELVLLYLTLSTLLGFAAALFGMCMPQLRAQYSAGLVALSLLGALSAPLTVLSTTALYGWRQPSSRQMLSSIAADLALLGGIALVLFRSEGSWIAYTCAAALFARQLLLCWLLDAWSTIQAALMKVGRAAGGLLAYLRGEGASEALLACYCFAAWSVDPFLYGLFEDASLVSTHLLTSRFTQAAIGIINVVLITALWQRRESHLLKGLQTTSIRSSWVFISLAAAMAAAAFWIADIDAAAAKVWVILFVITTTVIAVWRQHLSLQIFKHKIDLRQGASASMLALILVAKAYATMSSSVFLLEVVSISASAVYLYRLAQAKAPASS